LRLFPELARRLSKALPEGAGKGFRGLKAAVERDLEDRLVVAERQPVGSALEARKLDISVHADVEQRRELPVEMVSGERRDFAQHLDAQIVSEVLLDMPQHSLQSSMIVLAD
jgi:hypothetical protein